MSRAVSIGHALHWRYDRRARSYKAAGGVEVRAVEIPVGRGQVTLGWQLVVPHRRARPIFSNHTEAMFAAEGIEVQRPKRTRTRTRRSR